MERNSSLKRIIIGIIALLLNSIMIFTLCAIPVGSSQQHITEPTIFIVEEIVVEQIPMNSTTKQEVYIPSKVVEETVKSKLMEIEYIQPLNKEEALQSIQQIENYITYIYTIIPPPHKTNLYIIGYKIAYNNLNNARIICNQYKKDYDEFFAIEEKEAKWNKRYEEYPVATKVWKFMKEELNWNDYVCAGVLGNMMAECGGQTLALDYRNYDDTGHYYGICQWSKTYYDKIHEANLNEQLSFLKDTVQDEFKTFGYKYSKGFDYQDFIELEDAEDAALAFAKVYERCNSKHYKVRLKNALKAYKYFVD